MIPKMNFNFNNKFTRKKTSPSLPQFKMPEFKLNIPKMSHVTHMTYKPKLVPSIPRPTWNNQETNIHGWPIKKKKGYNYDKIVWDSRSKNLNVRKNNKKSIETRPRLSGGTFHVETFFEPGDEYTPVKGDYDNTNKSWILNEDYASKNMAWSKGLDTDPNFTSGEWDKKDPYYERRRVLMNPDEFLDRQFEQRPNKKSTFTEWVKPVSQQHVEKLKLAIQDPNVEVPVPIEEYDRYGHRKDFQEGRHRGLAAKELGIKVPVILARERAPTWDRVTPEDSFQHRIYDDPQSFKEKTKDNQFDEERGRFPLDHNDISKDNSENMARVTRHEEDYCEDCLQNAGECYTCGATFMPDDNIDCNEKGHKHKGCKPEKDNSNNKGFMVRDLTKKIDKLKQYNPKSPNEIRVKKRDLKRLEEDIEVWKVREKYIKSDDISENSAYGNYKKSVNMSYGELLKWKNNPCSAKASIGRTAINRNLKLLNKPASDWTANDAKESKKTISFNARMSQVSPGRPVSGCDMSKRDISLKNWAYNPQKDNSKNNETYIADNKRVEIKNNNPVPKKQVVTKVLKSIKDNPKQPLVFETRKQYLEEYIQNQEKKNGIKYSQEEKDNYIKNEMKEYKYIASKYTTKHNPYMKPKYVIFNDKKLSDKTFNDYMLHEYGHELYEKNKKLQKDWASVARTKSPTAYGATDKEEDFADSYMLYRTGKLKDSNRQRVFLASDNK